MGSTLDQETKVPHAIWHDKKKNFFKEKGKDTLIEEKGKFRGAGINKKSIGGNCEFKVQCIFIG